MTSKSNLSMQFLSRAVARRCVVARPAVSRGTSRQLHRSSVGTPIPRCQEVVHLSDYSDSSKFSQVVVPTRSLPHQRCHHFQQQQHRYFSEYTKESSNNDASNKTLARGAVQDLWSSNNTDYEPSSTGSDQHHTLHSNIHHILRIQWGGLTESNISKARAFLSIVSKWHNEQGATLAEALLERLYKEQSVGRNSKVVVDSEMYNICMDAWNKSNGTDGEKIVSHVESIMKRMEERYFNNDSNMYHHHDVDMARPDKLGYNCVLNAYSKWDTEQYSPNKVEGILEKMNALADDAASSDDAMEKAYELLIRPDAITYNSIMNYYATRKNQHHSAQRAEDLLLRMSELSKERQTPKNNIQMDAISFNIVLKAWSNSGGGIDGAQRAESVLRMMMKLYNNGHGNVRPDSLSFSTVISAYSKVKPEDATIAVERVMELLDELEGSYFPADSDRNNNVSSCYNAVANVIVKSGLKDAVDRVEELMERMRNMDASPDDGHMLVSLIEAYANEGSDDSFRRGKELLLEKMDGSSEPNSVPFNILMNSILKGNSTNRLEQADELMTLMEKIGENARPDVASYNMIISALSRASSDANELEQKAVDYLRSMLKSYREGYQKAKPDSFVFNCIISMLARSKQGKWADEVIYKTLMAMESQQKRGNTSVISDTITYNLVIGKLAQTVGSREHAKKVMNLLTRMEESSSHQSNKANIAPDIITYTNVLRVHEKVDQIKAAHIAASYLERSMSNKDEKQIQVDRLGFRTLLLSLSRSSIFEHAVTAHKAWEWMEKKSSDNKAKKHNVLDSDLCNLVLVAYSKANIANAAGETLSFLSERIGRYREGDKMTVLPTVVGFGAALASLGKANRIEDALRILEIMQVLSKDGVPKVEPDDRCYYSILGPLAHSQAENAPTQALRVVKRMKEDLGTISAPSLNAAINTCSRTSGSPIAKRKSVEIAFELLQLGRGCNSCDAVTYGLMIRTCIKLTEDEDTRFKLVEPLFKWCAKSGLVGNMVMREVQHFHFKRRLIPNGQLPVEWTMHARDK